MGKENVYENSIILIGPSGAGKSTIGNELQRITGLPRISTDNVAGMDRRTGYSMQFKHPDDYNVDMLQRVFDAIENEEQPYIIDFGAGHSVFKKEEKFEIVKNILGKYKNVILLLPSRNLQKSLDILASRSTGDISDNKEFIQSPCNQQLATMTIYEAGRTPREIAQEISKTIDNRDKSQIHEEQE